MIGDHAQHQVGLEQESACFRVEANSEIGLGHLTRCIAIAEAFSDSRIESHFICTSGSLESIRRQTELLPYISVWEIPSFEDTQMTNGLDVSDARQTIAIAKTCQSKWIFVDNYATSSSWESEVRKSPVILIAIDDMPSRVHDADVVIYPGLESQSPMGEPNGMTSTTRLAGQPHVLLRKAFHKPCRSLRDEIQSIGLCFGGTTTSLLPALVSRLADSVNHSLQYKIIVPKNLEDVVSSRKLDVALPSAELFVEPKNVAEVLESCDLVVGGAGVSALERVALRIPSVLVVLSENQRLQAQMLSAKGVAYLASGDPSASTSEQIEAVFNAIALFQAQPGLLMSMSQSCANFHLTQGPSRVVDLLVRGPSPSQVEFREANGADAELLWSWFLDPTMRVGKSNTSVDHKRVEHIQWLDSILKSVDRSLMIAEYANQPVGYVRFEPIGDGKRISYGLSKQYRGHGLGYLLVQHGLNTLSAGTRVVAHVSEGNIGSILTLKKCGFVQQDLGFLNRYPRTAIFTLST